MNEIKNSIYFDMDGTIADLYGVDGWLNYLENRSTVPYDEARPLVNMSALARRIHKLQNNGYTVGIISWLSKCGDDEYNQRVTEAKLNWLKKHLPSVVWNEIHIVEYGTPKSSVAENLGYLFDDELPNRIEWGFEVSFGVDNILEILKIFS